MRANSEPCKARCPLKKLMRTYPKPFGMPATEPHRARVCESICARILPSQDEGSQMRELPARAVYHLQIEAQSTASKVDDGYARTCSHRRCLAVPATLSVAIDSAPECKAGQYLMCKLYKRQWSSKRRVGKVADWILLI